MRFSRVTRQATSSSHPTISAGVLLKRPPILLRTPSTFETHYAQFSRQNSVSFGYNTEFFNLKINTDDDNDDKDASSKTNTKSVSNERHVNGDKMQNLNREPSRSLYLLFKTDSNDWTLPITAIGSYPSLHECIQDQLGNGTWGRRDKWETSVIGRVPAVHYSSGPDKKEKVFVMKAQVHSGQAAPEVDDASKKEFVWVTKEEMGTLLPREVFEQIQDAVPSL